MTLLNNQSCSITLKLNFSIKIDKLLFRFSVFYLWLSSLNFSIMDHLECCISHKLNPENLFLIISDKNQITSTHRSSSLAKSPEELLLICLTRLWLHLCFLELAKVCAKGFIKKEVVCFLLLLITYFFITLLTS